MTKAELLKLLSEEYKKTVRLPDDISLKDYKDTIEREAGIRISDKRAAHSLNVLVDRGDFVTLMVVERGKNVRIWRKVEQKGKQHVESRNTHRASAKRTGGVSKKDSTSKLASPVSVRSGQ